MKGKKKIQQVKKQPKTIAKDIVNDRQPMLMVVCGETGVGKTYPVTAI